MICFSMILPHLSTMIANAWAWATTHGKVYTHPVNKAEYIDIDVDSSPERQDERMSELSAQSTFVAEDGNTFIATIDWLLLLWRDARWVFAIYKWSSAMHVNCQDSSGSIFDEAVAPSGSGLVTPVGGGEGGQERIPVVKAPSFVWTLVPLMFLRHYTANFQNGSFMLTALTPNFLVTRKGPIERVSFPAANANVSPYQQVATYIMILGQKIDSAQTFKVGHQL